MFVSADITEGPLTTITLMKQPLRLLTSLIALTASTAAILPITNTMTNLGIPLTGSTSDRIDNWFSQGLRIDTTTITIHIKPKISGRNWKMH